MITANLRIVRASPAGEVAVGELVPSFERLLHRPRWDV